MHRAAAVVAVSLAAIAACSSSATPIGSPTTTTGTSAGASPPVSAVGSRSASASAVPVSPSPGLPRIRATIRGDGPIIASDSGPAGHPYALPAAFAESADGTAVLFVVWLAETPGQQVVTMATTRDGSAWTVDLTLVLTDLGLGFGPPGPVPSSVVRLDHGSWVLYGWGSAVSDRGQFVTWRATARDLGGPWTADPEPVLTAGPAGAWDSASVAGSTVIRDETGWSMWFDGDAGGSGIRGEIGLATSTDGRTWDRWDDPTTTEAGDPVVHKGACGAATAGSVGQPQVWRTTSGDRMLFAGLPVGLAVSSVFGATSLDGRGWSCAAAAPLLLAADIPGSGGLHRIRGGTLAGRPVLFVESLAGQGSAIWLADIDLGG